MSKEKQIEEMAFNLIMATSPLGVKDLTKQFDYKAVATDLYELYGWHKQSDGIVEVVRCKDCVNFKRSVSALFPHASAFICDCPYGLRKNVNENDFCCHGAKMKGGAE